MGVFVGIKVLLGTGVLVGIKVLVGMGVPVGVGPAVFVEIGVEVLLGVAVSTGVALATNMFDPVNSGWPLGPVGPFVTPVMGTNATVPVGVTVIFLDAITAGVIVRGAVAVGVGVYVSPAPITIRGCVSNL